MNEDFFEKMKDYALNHENYIKSREAHTKVFGAMFADAFGDSDVSALHFTAALNKITRRDFEGAVRILTPLLQVCNCPDDRAAVAYFLGFAYERLEDTEKMTEYYELAKSEGLVPMMMTQLHPYYYSGKAAQRDMRLKESVYYLKNALSFYEGISPTGQAAQTASYIMYDIATSLLTMHRYDDCERFLELSRIYSAAENQQREYVHAILLAVRGRADESLAKLDRLIPLLRDHGKPMAEAIIAKKDPHYCVLRKRRSKYGEFTEYLCQNKDRIYSAVCGGEVAAVEAELGEKLTEIFKFMKKKLDCRISAEDGVMTVRCRNFYVKTLISEQDALFASVNAAWDKWRFVSVGEYGEDDFEF